MRFYIEIENGYILSIGTGNSGEEISEERYNEVLSVILAKPQETETVDYRLREDLTWEQYEIDPPDPDPEIDDSEAFDIIFGGDGE